MLIWTEGLGLFLQNTKLTCRRRSMYESSHHLLYSHIGLIVIKLHTFKELHDLSLTLYRNIFGSLILRFPIGRRDLVCQTTRSERAQFEMWTDFLIPGLGICHLCDGV